MSYDLLLKIDAINPSTLGPSPCQSQFPISPPLEYEDPSGGRTDQVFT